MAWDWNLTISALNVLVGLVLASVGVWELRAARRTVNEFRTVAQSYNEEVAALREQVTALEARVGPSEDIQRAKVAVAEARERRLAAQANVKMAKGFLDLFRG